MKLKIPFIAALVAALPIASSGFTLDAAGYDGAELSLNPVSVFVPGYGELIFEAAVGSALVVNSAYQNDKGLGGPSLDFDPNEAVKITFNGLPPLNVNFDSASVSAGESIVVQKDLATLQGGGAGRDLNAVSWNSEAVPEATAAMLGLIGTAIFAFRRRR